MTEEPRDEWTRAFFGEDEAGQIDAIRELSEYLLGRARGLVGSASYAQEDVTIASEDLVQEVLLRLWRTKDRITTKKEAFAISSVMLRHAFIDNYRRQRKRPAEVEQVDIREVEEHGLSEGLWEWYPVALISGYVQPEEAAEASENLLERRELLAALSRIMTELSPQEQRIVYERFVQDRSLRQISESTGMTMSSVRTISLRALQKIRRALVE